MEWLKVDLALSKIKLRFTFGDCAQKPQRTAVLNDAQKATAVVFWDSGQSPHSKVARVLLLAFFKSELRFVFGDGSKTELGSLLGLRLTPYLAATGLWQRSKPDSKRDGFS